MLYRSVYNMNSLARPARSTSKKSAENGAKKRWRFHAFLHTLNLYLILYLGFRGYLSAYKLLSADTLLSPTKGRAP